MKILFLEDQPSLLQNPINFLRSQEFDVVEASCAEEVYVAFEQDIKPDICFFDIDLRFTEKTLNGLDVAESILKNNLNTPIIMYTHHSKVDAYFDRAEKLGLFFEDRNKLENNSWLLNQINKSAKFNQAKSTNIPQKTERFFLVESPEAVEYAETYHLLDPKEIVCIQSIPAKNHTNIFIRIRIRPIVLKVSIGDVFSFLQDKLNLQHLVKISANCYLDLSEVSTLQGALCTLRIGTEIELNGKGVTSILENFPMYLVHHMHSKKK